MGEERERRRKRSRRGLADEEESPAVETVGCASGPRRKEEDRRELREAQDSEQEGGMR
jgi:hypothetical protein